jgi:hypothetical protein
MSAYGEINNNQISHNYLVNKTLHLITEPEHSTPPIQTPITLSHFQQPPILESNGHEHSSSSQSPSAFHCRGLVHSLGF